MSKELDEARREGIRGLAYHLVRRASVEDEGRIALWLAVETAASELEALGDELNAALNDEPAHSNPSACTVKCQCYGDDSIDAIVDAPAADAVER